jgi:transcriptional regulator with XRE-family HTH domain
MLRMKLERLRRGWNQTKLAYLVRTSGPEISRIETGRTQPYPRQLARLSKVLGLSPDALMQEIDEPTAGNPDVLHEHR